MPCPTAREKIKNDGAVGVNFKKHLKEGEKSDIISMYIYFSERKHPNERKKV